MLHKLQKEAFENRIWYRFASDPLFRAQVGQDLGMFFARSQYLMTRRAVIRDRLAIGAGVVAIMAAESAARVVVPKIVGMRAPGHAHVGKDVAQVDVATSWSAC